MIDKNKCLKEIDKKKVLKKLKKNKKKENIFNKYTKLIPKINTKNNLYIVNNYLSKWKNNTNKINYRENKFKNALNIIDKRQVINSANDINNSLLINKFEQNIPYIREKIF